MLLLCWETDRTYLIVSCANPLILDAHILMSIEGKIFCYTTISNMRVTQGESRGGMVYHNWSTDICSWIRWLKSRYILKWRGATYIVWLTDSTDWDTYERTWFWYRVAERTASVVTDVDRLLGFDHLTWTHTLLHTVISHGGACYFFLKMRKTHGEVRLGLDKNSTGWKKMCDLSTQSVSKCRFNTKT